MPDPMYRQIADDLHAKIETGELAPGSPLPTEIELREFYGEVSQNTIRDAIKWLTTLGLIDEVPGRGPFVADRRGARPVVGRAEAEPVAGTYVWLDDASYPIYRRIADDLRRRIEAGNLMADVPLYNDVLREHYKTSRQSVRDALSWLASRKFIRTQPGRASVVLEGRSLREASGLSDSSHLMDRIDLDGVSSRLDFGCALAAVIRDAELSPGKVELRARSIRGGDLINYLSGRHLPRAPEILRDILMAYGVDEEEINHWLRMLARVRALLPEKEAEQFTSRDNDKMSLIFRVYVPSNRLYAAEANRLLSLFQDWLIRVRRLGIRYEGHSTAAGKVYEFWADAPLMHSDLTEEFSHFSGFLRLCARDPRAAAERLIEVGIEPRLSSGLAALFGREARRLEVDARHERERLILSIRHDLEEELLDKATYLRNMPDNYISNLLDTLVPIPSASAPMSLLVGPEPTGQAPPITLNINNPQFINAVRSTVAHHIEGSVHFGPDAKEILTLIESFGGQESAMLRSALHEIEDTNARPDDRMAAVRLLKKFLSRLTDTAQEIAAGLLEKYIEHRTGL